MTRPHFPPPFTGEVLSAAKRRGRGRWNLEKSTHNSVVEASMFANECFVPENRDEFRADKAHSKKLGTIKLSNIGTVTHQTAFGPPSRKLETLLGECSAGRRLEVLLERQCPLSIRKRKIAFESPR